MSKNTARLSEEELLESARIWHKASVEIVDIRFIKNKYYMKKYKLPANAFIFFKGGKLQFSIDDILYNVEKFALFHGRKGATLNIKEIEDCDIEYYIIFYKDERGQIKGKIYENSLERFNPFNINYGFVPYSSLLYSEILKEMYQKWDSHNSIDLLYCNALFKKLVYLIHKELIEGKNGCFQNDTVEMAINYLDENYSKEISIKELCKNLGISYSHFHRIFKEETGKSPQEYLINNRLKKSKDLLENTQFSIREIAEFCGFQDERNLQRTFSKKIGLSPNRFRENMSDNKRGKDIETHYQLIYDENEFNWKGVNNMFKQLTKEGFIAIALSCMIFLTGCSGNISNNDLKEEGNKVEITEEKETRIIDTEMGKVEIPVKPKRVVATVIQGDVLAFDIMPVGTSFNTGAVFENNLSDSTEINAFEINPEEIMALKPDLILWNSNDKEAYETLSKIAPTVVQDYFGMEYQERLRFLGDILNQEDKAEKLISDFEKKTSDARVKLEEKGLKDKTALCMEKREDMLVVSWAGRGAPLMYDLLGFKMPEKIEEASKDKKNQVGGGMKLSYEVMSEYAGDVILINGDLGGFGENAVWKNLPAVKDGKVIYAPSNMFWFNDILSMNGQVDLIMEKLIGEK